MIQTYSMLRPIILWDGASWRRMKFTEYKANRDKRDTKHEVEAAKAKDDFKSQVPYIRLALKHLGVRQMFAINYEADDLAGVLVERYTKEERKVVMVSADKDWVQLLRPNAIWIDPVRDYRLTAKSISERLGWNPAKGKIVCAKGDQIEGFIGVPSPQAWLEMKALMGDMGDNIPGVGGIGPKGALELVKTYGSVASFFNQIADKSVDPTTLPKKLRDFAEDPAKHDLYRRNIQLMDLRSPERPAWINAKIDKGELNREKFAGFCNRLAFNSITTDLDKWIEPFVQKELELS